MFNHLIIKIMKKVSLVILFALITWTTSVFACDGLVYTNDVGGAKADLCANCSSGAVELYDIDTGEIMTWTTGDCPRSMA